MAGVAQEFGEKRLPNGRNRRRPAQEVGYGSREGGKAFPLPCHFWFSSVFGEFRTDLAELNADGAQFSELSKASG